MTVKELIDILSEYDPNMLVLGGGFDLYGHYPLDIKDFKTGKAGVITWIRFDDGEQSRAPLDIEDFKTGKAE